MTPDTARHSHQRRLLTRVTTLACGIAMITATPAFASSIQIAGITGGCFGLGCLTFESSASSGSPFGLTFDGVDPFDITTDANGAATGIPLGTFTRANMNVSDALDPLPFSLLITFTQPTVNGGPLTGSSLIIGTSPGGGGPLDINFDNTWYDLPFTVNGTADTMQFRISNDPHASKNGTVAVYGEVRDVPSTNREQLEQTAPVPEPASLTLLGSGMAAAAWRARRRRKGERGSSLAPR